MLLDYNIYHIIIRVSCRNKLVNVEASCTGPGSDLSKRVKWVRDWSYPNLKYYSTVSYVNQGNWLGEIPVYPGEEYSRTDLPIHTRGDY